MREAATNELHEAIVKAAEVDIPHSAIAEVCGYSEGRVWQIVNDWQRPAVERKGKGTDE